jgi:hypothetical protein
LLPWHWIVIGVILLGLLILRRVVLLQIARFTDPAIEERDWDDNANRGFLSRQLHRLGRVFGRS